MKILKNENGIITVLVLISILLMVSFLLTIYAINANKIKAQKEIMLQIKNVYGNSKSMNEIYDTYFNQGNIIPIYTVDQLLAMGDETKKLCSDGKYYTFANDANTIYLLMNNLEFKASNYSTKLPSGYWIPVGDNEDLTSKFEGKRYTIKVEYTDLDNVNYSIIYSKENEFAEPEYNVTVTPLLPNNTTADEAEIFVDDETTPRITGVGSVKVKRHKGTIVRAHLDGYADISQNITIQNPDTISDIELRFSNTSTS